jgi:uncharacterized protein YkwD
MLLVALFACYADVTLADPPPPSACERWTDDRATFTEGQWSGDVGACDAGTLTDEAKASTVANVNLYRWLAGLPEVVDDADKNDIAQACSLMMEANQTIDHFPSQSWDCYTQTGADGAASSNLATTASVVAVDLYIADPGNETTLGHRRWILSNSLGPIGVGGAAAFSCLHVIGGTGNAGRSWTAWPPEGDVPLEAFTAGWASIDETGWSVQSDSLALGSAEVTITKDGEELPVNVEQLEPGYGSNDAIKITPDGWTTEAGTYAVEVTGAGEDIAYDVNVQDCAVELAED